MKIGSRLLRQLCIVFSLVMCASIAGAASAQGYPNKPIRIIVPYAPGGGTDQVARMIGLKLGAAFGQPVIIDNRGGAAGNIGTELAAKAVPDGYTLLWATSSHAINPSLYRKLSYDVARDFAPITQVNTNAYILVVHPSVPAKTVKEFIALANSKKGGITYASSGVGSPGHLGMELLKTLAGFDAVQVPYKGAGPAIIDLIAGQVHAYILSPLMALPHVRSGKIRALAVTSLKRSALLPDVPTVAEAGFPGYEVSGWYGLLALAGTPREVVTKLYKEISRSLKLPDVMDRMAVDGTEPVGSTPQEFAAYIQAETIKWAKVIKQSGARVD
ncbi:MAG: tripartite tricarboxylate transporter substrate binding protein [Betaproteobacteria bacterium]|nr:tripartite tricarboxylate transporter substrate binding protein [Betaproteobacteria bacterium]